MNVSGATFLISGGASGLGAATATRLTAAGANVVIGDINKALGIQLRDKLGSTAVYVETDVTRQDSVQEAIDTATNQFGRLDGAVNCAGTAVAAKTVGRKGPHPLDAFAKVLEVNLIGSFNVARLAAAAMSQNSAQVANGTDGDSDGERGVIINTASIAAYEAQQGQVAYAASKGGIVSMTLPMARDLAEYGIRVVTIAPGVFETPLMAGVPDGVRERLAEEIPFPSRFGRPNEFAALVLHCIENPMLNGTVIRLDGALRMPAR